MLATANHTTTDNVPVIKLAQTVRFDAAKATTQTFAFMGRRGSGKTYAFGVLAEGLLRARQQLVIIDPVGVHWGLRLASNGVDHGLNVPVFGGEHGDVPLTVTSGEMVAELIIERRLSAILDVSGFKPAQRKTFVASFCEAFFHLKKKNKSPVHVCFEEAHLFAPQEKRGEGKSNAPDMLGAVEDIVRLGRNYGIGCSLISQRPQEVNKGILNQTEVLVAMQMNGDLDREAIARWAKSNASATEAAGAASITDMLPDLDVGEAIVWSPQWLKVRVKTRIEKKTTYDSSRTPDGTDLMREPRPLSADELGKLRDSMTAVSLEVADRDPKRLRERLAAVEAERDRLKGDSDALVKSCDALIADAHRERDAASKVMSPQAQALVLSAAIAEIGLPKPRTEDETWRAVAALKDIVTVARNLQGEVQLAASHLNNVQTGISTINGLLDLPNRVGLSDSERRIETAIRKHGVETIVQNHTILSPRIDKQALAKHNGVIEKAPIARAHDLRKGARVMLDVLVARHPKPVTRAQLATLAGMAVTGGTFNSYVSALKKTGLVQEDNAGDFYIRADTFHKLAPGMSGIGKASVGRESVLALWRPKLRGGAKRMLQALIDRHDTSDNPNMSLEELAQIAELTRNAGTFNSYLSSLKSAGLVDVFDKHASISEEIMQ